MATTPAVPPIPYKVPISNDDHFIVEAWSKFLRQLYDRVGGAIALSNLELQALQTSNVTALNASITALQTRVTTLESEISAVNGFDFNQGPTL